MICLGLSYIPIIRSLTDTAEYNVKNSFELIDRLKTVKIKDEVLISLDVIGLFPHIPIDFTLALIKEKLHQHVWTGITEDTFLRALRFCCVEANYFCFRGEYYGHIDGCPMGGRISSDIADFLMNLLLAYVKRLLSFTPRLLIKYVDDLTMIVPKDELPNILPAFNSFQHTIHDGDRNRWQTPVFGPRAHK